MDEAEVAWNQFLESYFYPQELGAIAARAMDVYGKGTVNLVEARNGLDAVNAP